MTDQFSDLIRIIGITILITFFWAASVAFTYWDAHQQHLPAGKALIWLLTVALLPLIGFIIYISFRILAQLISIPNGPKLNTRRETPLRHPLSKKGPLPTLYASDLSKQTVFDSEEAIQPAADHPMLTAKYVLTVSSGSDRGKEFIVTDLPSRIGRGSHTSIRLDGDLGVSREHAEIYEQAGMLKVRDLKSTHGTQVNGVRIEDQSLKTGDRIQIGLTELVVKIIRV